MRVFVTGATGWVGSAVVKDLLSSGHEVVGLTTTPQGARKLQALGAKARVGRLGDHDLLRQAAAESDGVIHTAFIHGLPNMSLATRFRLFAGALNGGVVTSFLRILQQTEAGAIGALGAGLEGYARPLVVASAVLALPQGRVSNERDNHVLTLPNRSFSEAAALRFCRARGSLDDRAACPDRSRRRRPWLRRPHHRRRAQEGRFPLYRRRRQSMARRACVRRGKALPPCPRERRSGGEVPRRR